MPRKIASFLHSMWSFLNPEDQRLTVQTPAYCTVRVVASGMRRSRILQEMVVKSSMQSAGYARKASKQPGHSSTLHAFEENRLVIYGNFATTEGNKTLPMSDELSLIRDPQTQDSKRTSQICSVFANKFGFCRQRTIMRNVLQ